MGSITIGEAALIAVTGYMVDFMGILLLMLVIIAIGKFFASRKPAVEENIKKAEVTAVKAEQPKTEPAPGSAGELKLYDTDPKDAALIMAIVADHLGKPLNELRFKSIKEVK